MFLLNTRPQELWGRDLTGRALELIYLMIYFTNLDAKWRTVNDSWHIRPEFL